MPELSVQDAFGVKGLNLTATGEFVGPKAPLDGPQEQLELKVGGEASSSWQVFDKAFKVNAKAGAALTLKIYPAGAAVKGPFGVDASPGMMQRWGEFTIDGALEASAEGSTTYGSLKISAAAAASAELKYRHLLPLQPNVSVENAVDGLLVRARRPGSFVAGLEAGESHSFSSRLKFGLDVKTQVGFQAEAKKTLKLFDDFSPEIKASAEATISASLGLSYFEATDITVLRQMDWPVDLLRLRISRKRQRGLTLGAKVAIAVQHNVGDVLSQTLDHVFALEPVADALSTMEEIVEYAKKVGTDQGWDGLIAELSKKASDKVFGTLWADLDSNEDIKAFTAKVAKFLDAYKSIDEQLQDLWADLLEHARVDDDSEIRASLKAIAELAGLDRAKIIEALVAKRIGGEPEKRVVQLLEQLTGETLEGLISGFVPDVDDLETAVEKAAGLAQKGLDFLDGSLIKEFSDRLRAYSEKAGIAGVVKWLAANASSPGALKGAVQASVIKVISRLFHKAVKDVDANERQRLQTWAQNLADELDGGLEKLDARRAEIKENLAKLDEEIGFSLSFELSRQFFEEAFLDAEIRSGLWKDVSRRWQEGDLPKLLQELSQAAAAQEGKGAPQVRILECSLLTRRIRKTGWALTLKALGLEWLAKTGTMSMVESLDRQTEGQPRKVMVRAVSVHYADLKLDTWSSSAELWINGDGGKFGDPFVPKIATITLGVVISDGAIAEAELKALDRLLDELGLVGPTSAQLAVGDHELVRFGLQLTFQAALDELIQAVAPDLSASVAKTQLLVASKRMFSDELVHLGELRDEGLRVGSIFEAFVAEPARLKPLTTGRQETEDNIRTNRQIKVGKEEVRMTASGGFRIRAPYYTLVEMAAVMADLPGLDRAVRASAKELPAAQLTSYYSALGSRFARLSQKLRYSAYFYNPMLAFWLFNARLSALTGVEVRGAASLQVKEVGAGTDAWSAPKLWVRG